jgi:hypothetical protein
MVSDYSLGISKLSYICFIAIYEQITRWYHLCSYPNIKEFILFKLLHDGSH